MTPTLGKGAPEDPVLPFCLFREHSKPRGWANTFPGSLQADPARRQCKHLHCAHRTVGHRGLSKGRLEVPGLQPFSSESLGLGTGRGCCCNTKAP